MTDWVSKRVSKV